MPLQKGASREVIGNNIREMQSAGHPHNVAVAAALHNADLSHHQHRASGGLSLTPSFTERAAARDLGREDEFHPSGLFKSDVAGRTDRLPRAVTADSFVVPADVISGLGQGNTLAGSKIMDAMLSSGPYGTSLLRSRRADGGNTPGISNVMVAGGEYLIPREKLIEIGGRMRLSGKSKARSDLAAGHEWARGLVDKVRQKQRKFLANAPKPKR